MTVDLKWGLPFVLPFALLALARGVFWFAGAAWTDPGAAAAGALLFGVPMGLIATAGLCVEEIRWPVTIGKPKGESEANEIRIGVEQ